MILLLKMGGNKMKKVLKTILVLAATVMVSVQSSVTLQSIKAQEEKVLNLSIGSEPPSIDPALASDTTSGTVVRNVFERLTTSDENGEPQAAGAVEWVMSEDGLTYTFTLQPDATWTTGDPVTANDFEYGWKRVLNPDTISPMASLLYVIEGAEAYNTGEAEADSVKITALDDLTLEVQLTDPTPYFLELISNQAFAPIHQATVEENSDWALEAGENYVTNGPFSLTEWVHSGYYILSNNEAYWDADAVQLDTVNVQIIDSQSTANISFQSGELDYVGTPFSYVSLDAIDLYRQEEVLNEKSLASTYFYAFNTQDPVMSNLNIRKALTLAIDRQSIVDNILKGGETPAMGLIPPSIKGFEEDRGYYTDADFDSAREFLETGLSELGIADPSELSIQLSFNTSEAHSAIAQHIQATWAEQLGIDVQLSNTEWQVHLANLDGLQHQVARLGWYSEYNDANSLLSMYKTVEHGNNYTGWENEEYQALLDQAAAELDADKRVEYLLAAEAVYMSELPILPIYYYNNLYVVQDNVHNMVPDPLGNIELKYVTVD